MDDNNKSDERSTLPLMEDSEQVSSDDDNYAGFYELLLNFRIQPRNNQSQPVDLLVDPDAASAIVPETKCLPTNDTINYNGDGKCAVCLEPYEIPIQLSCGHVFCFTCTKGLARSNNLCALCRFPIPFEFVTNPERFTTEPLREPIAGHFWFYRSRSGWWAHTPRLQTELENAFQSKKSSFVSLFDGMSCVFDLERYIQTFGYLPPIKQRILRNISGTFWHRGVAGLRYNKSPGYRPIFPSASPNTSRP